jgi:hypothetical protein
MNTASIPTKSLAFLLEDAASRDLSLRRRMALLTILLGERYLDRGQLIMRVEALLGKDCFGAAWQDVFYRDMRLVKSALKAAGFQLAYSRSSKRSGYYLKGQPELSEQLANTIRQSAGEVDPKQVKIFHRLSPAERFRLGCSVTDTARNAVAYRLRQQNPELSPVEASLLAVQGKPDER